GEPCLLHDLPVCRLADPQRRLERAAMLVHGQGMEGELHRRAERGVEELELALVERLKRAERNAERADGVPDGDALDGRVVLDGEVLPEALRLVSPGLDSLSVERLRV